MNTHPMELTEAEVIRGKLLSPDTIKLLTSEVFNLTVQLCNYSFPADPNEREIAVLSYVEAQAKRNTLLGLIDEAAETRATLVESQSFPASN